MRRFFSHPAEAPGQGDSQVAPDRSLEVFVFPLKDAVFFPTVTLPLNIFEPRYLKMVRLSLRTHTPIALLGQNPLLKGREPDMVAGYGYPILLEEREDGTMTILLKGCGKLRLTHVLQELPFIACRAELIEESFELSDDSLIQLARLRSVLNNWMGAHIHDEAQKIALSQSLEEPRQLVECMASLFLGDVELKKLILETDDINDRIHILNPLINEDGSVTPVSLVNLN